MQPQIAGLGPGEIALILAVLVLLFGASKLPELARGSGRALRIFKAETKGLMDDGKDKEATDHLGDKAPADSSRQPLVGEVTKPVADPVQRVNER